jgi:hypothetical protein
MRQILIVLALLTGLTTSSAQAHFKLNQNVRIYHVVHTDQGLDVYLRTPMSYLVAGLIGPMAADGLPEPAPFTTNRIEDGVLMHYVAQSMLRANPTGLARIAADALIIQANGGALPYAVAGLRAYPIGQEPGFATQSEAEVVFAEDMVFPHSVGDTYVGDTMIDIHLRYGTAPVGPYLISTTTDPGLPGQDQTANLILDYDGTDVRTFRNTGLMQAPFQVLGSSAAAASTFFIEGIQHIFSGLDHVLFVLCMVIGARGLRSLLGRVTGFTIGHSVTLIFGFFGFAPTGAWFIPTVEIAIALSIIYAATMAALRPIETRDDEHRAIAITSAIGLLHGFGFSFMLRQILQVDAPNVWQSLLAFNIGVEVGQFAIILLVWPLLLVLRAMPERVWVGSRTVLACTAAIIATGWVVERAEAFL